MYKKQIQQIYNIISVNCQRLKSMDLLNGDLGICLFFYNYAYYQGETSDYADDILTKMIKLYQKSYMPNSSGVYELGWSIKYLDEHNYVKNDPSIWDIFNSFSMSDYSVAKIEKDLNSPLSIFTKGLYLCKSSSPQMIEKTLSDIKNVLNYINETRNIPLRFLVSLCYCLQKCMDKKEYICQSLQLEEKLLGIIEKKIRTDSPLSKDVYILYRLLNCEAPKWLPIYEYNVINDIYTNWQTVLYEDLISLPDSPDMEQLEEYLSDINLHVPVDKLGLDGLCSLGINLIRKSPQFVC